MRLRQALANSYNVPAVQVMSWVGVNKVLRTAHSLGINSLHQGQRQLRPLCSPSAAAKCPCWTWSTPSSVMDNMG
ncbi:MAG: hypothetical protein H6656_21170 [Ardenticatenaceae bacterium]|nr:hypothetical protein [Ardenticatenaceae bacterium]